MSKSVINLKPNEKYVLLNGIYFNERRDGNSISSKSIKYGCPKLKTTMIYGILSKMTKQGIINSVGIGSNRAVILTEFGISVINDLKNEIDVLRYIEFMKRVKVEQIVKIKNVPDDKKRLMVNNEIVEAIKNKKNTYIIVVDSEIANGDE